MIRKAREALIDPIIFDKETQLAKRLLLGLLRPDAAFQDVRLTISRLSLRVDLG